MSLITPFEVIKYSSAGRDYPSAQFCDLIDQIEETFARECLTEELYDYLISVLQAYPQTVREWDCNAIYSSGQFVVYNGCTFESQKNANRTQPGVNDDWEQLERFTETGANLLWTKYLRRILAQMVYVETLTPTTFKSGANGIIVGQSAYGQGDFRSAGKSELNDVKQNIFKDIERTKANMLHWLNDNAETNELPWQSTCGGSNCQRNVHRSRRWNFVR